MIQIAFLRHGITSWNIEHRIQGHTDTPLSDQARSQLKDLKLPSQFHRSRVYVSPLQRARETAALLTNHDEFILVDALMEMSWGEWEGRKLQHIRSQLGKSMRDNEARGLDFQPPGGETPRLVQRRLLTWINTLEQDSLPILAVTHKGVIRAAYCSATGWDLHGKPPNRLDWSCLQLFEFNHEGTLKIKRLNVPLELKRSLGSTRR